MVKEGLLYQSCKEATVAIGSSCGSLSSLQDNATVLSQARQLILREVLVPLRIYAADINLSAPCPLFAWRL